MKQYVQHRSGQGEKWEVDHCVHARDVWSIKSNTWIRLPKSEYILCDPPEEWEDVTAECDFTSQFGLGVRVMDGSNCRLRKLDGPHNGPCFIVERKKA